MVENHRCKWRYALFDPTVPSSPLVRFEADTCQGSCLPEFDVDASTIDSDRVMDKILLKPKIAPLLLTNIYNRRKRMGTLGELEGTKLGRFYSVNSGFFNCS